MYEIVLPPYDGGCCPPTEHGADGKRPTSAEIARRLLDAATRLQQIHIDPDGKRITHTDPDTAKGIASGPVGPGEKEGVAFQLRNE